MGFLRKPRHADGSLALAAGADGVHAAVVVRRPGALAQVKAAAWFDAAASAEAFERIGKQMRAGQYRSSCLLAPGEYQMLSLDAPAVPADELKTAVRWMLKDMLDYAVDDATIDVLGVPLDRAGGQRNSMFAVAARNSVIEARQTLFTTARLGLAAIDVPEMAQRNIAALLEEPGRGLAMLSFGASGCLLTVTFEGQLYLARRLEVTLADLLQAASELSDELASAAVSAASADIEAGAAGEQRHPVFDKLTLLLQRSLDHFERQFHTIALSRLVLAPSAVKGLADYLGRNLYTAVHALDLHEVFDLARVPLLLDLAEQQRFFLALGAALRQEAVLPAAGMGQQINLINPRFQPRTTLFCTLAMARALTLLLLGCMLLALVGQYNGIVLERIAVAGAARLASEQARLDQVNVDYAPRQRSKTLAAELSGQEAKSALLRDAARAIERDELGNKAGYADVFKALARQTMEGVWLTAIRIDGADGGIGLQGRALEAARVPAYLQQLGHEPLLQGRRFAGLRIGPAKSLGEGGVSFVEFTLDSSTEAIADSALAGEVHR
ncbi:PilN domain-containing protein [Massilia sp. PWRC2]|uniref:PilN domain-containing protein n=1 Tax=Massilia sp. PWRC2 TaxID=2804626 RepID=UPI003CF5A773